MDKRRVRLTINGVVCGVITGETEEYMQSLADEVGRLMTQIMSASPLITREAAALTAALSICDDSHKFSERASRLQERVELLEVEAELWQEEKVELLKSAVDGERDAGLSEKAARLESENAMLEETISRLKEDGARDAELIQENTALAARERELTQENISLRDRVERLSDAAQRREEALKLAEERLQENKALQERLDRLTDTVHRNEEALKSAEEKLQKAVADAKKAAAKEAMNQPAERVISPPKRPNDRRKNPMRYDEEFPQEGIVAFFKRDDM